MLRKFDPLFLKHPVYKMQVYEKFTEENDYIRLDSVYISLYFISFMLIICIYTYLILTLLNSRIC